MENPTAVIKSAIQPGTVVKGILGAIIIFAVFDLLGQTDFIVKPVTWLKNKFAKPAA